MSYYAVRNGRRPGVYGDWNSCDRQVNGYSNNEHKKFDNYREAQNYVHGGSDWSSSSYSRGSAPGPSYSSDTQFKGYYAVQEGRNPGVYSNWREAKAQVDGYSGNVHKRCDSLREAESFVRSKSHNNSGSYTNYSGYYKKY